MSHPTHSDLIIIGSMCMQVAGPMVLPSSPPAFLPDLGASLASWQTLPNPQSLEIPFHAPRHRTWSVAPRRRKMQTCEALLNCWVCPSEAGASFDTAFRAPRSEAIPMHASKDVNVGCPAQLMLARTFMTAGFNEEGGVSPPIISHLGSSCTVRLFRQLRCLRRLSPGMLPAASCWKATVKATNLEAFASTRTDKEGRGVSMLFGFDGGCCLQARRELHQRGKDLRCGTACRHLLRMIPRFRKRLLWPGRVPKL